MARLNLRAAKKQPQHTGAQPGSFRIGTARGGERTPLFQEFRWDKGSNQWAAFALSGEFGLCQEPNITLDVASHERARKPISASDLLIDQSIAGRLRVRDYSCAVGGLTWRPLS